MGLIVSGLGKLESQFGSGCGVTEMDCYSTTATTTRSGGKKLRVRMTRMMLIANLPNAATGPLLQCKQLPQNLPDSLEKRLATGKRAIRILQATKSHKRRGHHFQWCEKRQMGL